MAENIILIIEISSALVTLFSGLGALLGALYKRRTEIFYEFWKLPFSNRIKEYLPLQYAATGCSGRCSRNADRFIVKLLQKKNGPRLILITGESGAGKSFLMQKVCHTLIIKNGRRHKMKYVNAVSLHDFKELSGDKELSEQILFLDGLDEYEDFLKAQTGKELLAIFSDLQCSLKKYGRVVISVRNAFYMQNREHFEHLAFRLAGNEVQPIVKIAINGLNQRQIQKYLRHKMHVGADEVKKCLKMVSASEEVLSRPLFLRFLTSLSEDYQVTNPDMNLYEIYERILTGWFQRERNKADEEGKILEKADLKKVFDRMTELYFIRKQQGIAEVFFKPDEVINAKDRVYGDIVGSRSLLVYEEGRGYACIHSSFFEFNYVRMHYKKLCLSKNSSKIVFSRGVKLFFGEYHYRKVFSAAFPETDIILLGTGMKKLSDLQPAETGEILEIHINSSKDLLNKHFRIFLTGLFYVKFQLGRFKIDCSEFRCLVWNKNIRLCNINRRMRSLNCVDLEWFAGFPVSSLNISHMGVQNLSFLKYFPQLKKLICVGNQHVMLSDLKNCHSLEYLNVSNCALTSEDIREILPASLRILIVANNELSDLDFVATLSLSYLDVSDNPLQPDAEQVFGSLQKYRCVYHFKCRTLKRLFLNPTDNEDIEAQYSDIMSANKDPFFLMSVNYSDITSLCGLENIWFSKLQVPFELVPMLFQIDENRSLHIREVDIPMFERCEYKLGMELCQIFQLLNMISTSQQSFNVARAIYDIVDDLFSYIIFSYKGKNGDRVFCWNDLVSEKVEKSARIAMANELLLLAESCSDYMLKNNNHTIRVKNSTTLEVLKYYEKQPQNLIGFNQISLPELTRQYKKFRKQGEDMLNVLTHLKDRVKTGEPKIQCMFPLVGTRQALTLSKTKENGKIQRKVIWNF
ncbi:MAG: hypothetical protein LUG99_10840 [Lachnospiraceae bacterium]|nr:hypothetical protein [Lachnospiraceae bacterium]